LNAWNLEYTQRLQRFDYYQAGQPSAAEEEAFEHEGVRLWQQLRAELGPTYVVYYAPVFTQLYRPNRPHRLYAHPDEYEAEGEN
jgi:hypothetical protein